jgi:hypothetical protein
MAITPENRKALKKLGYQQVLILLLNPMSDAFTPEGRLQAQEWISEQERDQRRYSPR